MAKDYHSVPNPVDAPKWRLIRPFFDRENEYKAVSSPRYAEKEQFCSLPGGVNTVGDTIKDYQVRQVIKAVERLERNEENDE